MKQLMILCSLLILSFSSVYAGENELTDAEKKDGWKLLFDGKTIEHFRNYNKKGVSDKWKVKDGTITLEGKGGGDLVTKEKYGSYEFKMQWRISPGGNSGLFIHAQETKGPIYKTAMEMQILCNEKGNDAKHPKKVAGTCYDMWEVDKALAKKAGEWNQVHLIIDGKKMKFIFNGTVTAEFVVGEEKWNTALAKSKFKKWKEFAKYDSGHIGLQDHGNVVSFRNIKIKDSSK
jgi:hypothetical protein